MSCFPYSVTREFPGARVFCDNLSKQDAEAILRRVLGVLYTLVAAASFGINNATARRAVITGTVTQMVAISMPIGLVMFIAVASVSGQIGEIGRFSPGAFAMLAAAGVVHFVIGRYCAYRCIQAMGANLAAPVMQWSLLVTLTLAVVFLHETLGLMKLLGIGLMVLGPAMVVSAQRRRARRRADRVQPEAEGPAPATFGPVKFQPKFAQGYLFGILACLGWGSSPILVRAGLEGTGLPLAGGVVAYGAATLTVVLVLLLAPAARRDASGIDGRNVVWFICTGFTASFSQIFLYLAMAIAPVTVVQPLMRFANIFGTLFGWMFNRDYEIFDATVLAAIGLSVAGALLLSLDAGWVMRWLDAPPWLAAALLWSWPGR